MDSQLIVVCEVDGVLVELVAPFETYKGADNFAREMNARADSLTDHIRWSTHTTTLPEDVRAR
jgi:hypothetical protein